MAREAGLALGALTVTDVPCGPEMGGGDTWTVDSWTGLMALHGHLPLGTSGEERQDKGPGPSPPPLLASAPHLLFSEPTNAGHTCGKWRALLFS